MDLKIYKDKQEVAEQFSGYFVDQLKIKILFTSRCREGVLQK